MSLESLFGDPLSPGLAVGHLLVPDVFRQEAAPTAPADPVAEIERFKLQLDALSGQIENAAERLEAEAFAGEAEILRAHLLMLQDPELHRQVIGFIEGECHRAEVAVERVLIGMASLLGDASDPVLAERAADLRDLARRFAARLSDEGGLDLRALAGRREDSVVALPELLPSLVLEARELGVVAFIVEY
jgi:phosphoenolpyruvate-protein kinase (PTS system EI component)